MIRPSPSHQTMGVVHDCGGRVGQLGRIYLDILVPVFALVVLGYAAGPRLGLDARTLARVAYFLLVPAYNFTILSAAKIEAAVAGRILLFTAAMEVAVALAGFAVGRLLRRSPRTIAAFVLVAVFPNVGNFGIPIVQFAFGTEALTVAVLYFVAINVLSFAIGVAAANWHHGSPVRAMGAVFRTPALLAVPPALAFNALHWSVPLALSRPLALLAGAMVPVMLVALGVQLAAAPIPRISVDMVMANAVRLVGGPALAALIAIPLGVSGLTRDAGILQASMPTAVFASIIAFEHDLLPSFVTATVLVSTLASIVTLAVVLAII
jgi:predicted permease